MSGTARGWSLAAGLTVAGAVAVWLATATLNNYLLTLIAFAGINVILAVSLTLANGLTGLFSLGHPAFMMVGGYVAAILTFPASRKGFMLPDLPDWLAAQQWPLLPALLAGGAAAGIAAVIVGFPVLRLRGHYLAVATLGLIFILRAVVNNLDGYTRGALGLSGIPRLTDLWWVYGWAVATIFVCWRIKQSSLGRTMMAMRENEMAAACMGVPLARTRLLAFAIGAILAGIAGGLWAHLVTNLTPTSLGVFLAFQIVVMIVLGGQGSITGAAVAALGLSAIANLLRPVEQTTGLYGLTQIVVALVLIGVLIFRSQGLFGSREPAFLQGKAVPSLSERQPATPDNTDPQRGST